MRLGDWGIQRASIPTSGEVCGAGLGATTGFSGGGGRGSAAQADAVPAHGMSWPGPGAAGVRHKLRTVNLDGERVDRPPACLPSPSGDTISSCAGSTPQLAVRPKRSVRSGSLHFARSSHWLGEKVVSWGVRIVEQEPQHLRVLIANEQRDRLELLAQVVSRLGHDVIAREIYVKEVGAVTERERPDVALVGLGLEFRARTRSDHRDRPGGVVPGDRAPSREGPGLCPRSGKAWRLRLHRRWRCRRLQSAIDITLQRFADTRASRARSAGVR